MTKRYCYLAGPIAGCDKKEANDWRKYVQSKLKDSNIVGVSPLRCEPVVGEKYELSYKDKKFGTPGAISGKNWFDTNVCDIVIAYLPKELEKKPSYGTIIEIGWALGMQKPVILVSDNPRLTEHPLIKHNVNWILDDLDDAIDVVYGILEVYT